MHVLILKQPVDTKADYICYFDYLIISQKNTYWAVNSSVVVFKLPAITLKVP